MADWFERGSPVPEIEDLSDLWPASEATESMLVVDPLQDLFPRQPEATPAIVRFDPPPAPAAPDPALDLNGLGDELFDVGPTADEPAKDEPTAPADRSDFQRAAAEFHRFAEMFHAFATARRHRDLL